MISQVLSAGITFAGSVWWTRAGMKDRLAIGQTANGSSSGVTPKPEILLIAHKKRVLHRIGL